MKKTPLTRKQDSDAGMAATLLLLLGYWFFPSRPLLAGATLCLVANMIWPGVFRPFAIFWYGLSSILGAVVSRIILGIVFFGIVTPIGLLIKVAGKDSLKLKKMKDSPGSLLVEKNKTFESKDLIHPYS